MRRDSQIDSVLNNKLGETYEDITRLKIDATLMQLVDSYLNHILIIRWKLH